MLAPAAFYHGGPNAPDRLRVFAGNTEVLPNGAGNYVIPLRDASGKVIVDAAAGCGQPAPMSGIPRGSYVVVRLGGGRVLQGLAGYLKKSWVAVDLTATVQGGLDGKETNRSFEAQGDGVALLGKASQDEFFRLQGGVRIQATVTVAADLIEVQYCE